MVLANIVSASCLSMVLAKIFRNDTPPSSTDETVKYSVFHKALNAQLQFLCFVSFQGTQPPTGSNTRNIENQSIKNAVDNPAPLNKSSWESEGHKPVKLPPLQEALSGSRHKEDHKTLPPIRGSGLPALVPSASSADSDNDQASLSRRASLFQVS